ncbi:MAG: hypothetical protein RDA78_17890 [Roseibium sp.]|uniref:hypothetical protein n=1 Tax=Roseibium sp. TaxID=1936156 RepID=UPI003D9C5853
MKHRIARLFLRTCIALPAVAIATVIPANAQVPPEKEAGWQSDVGGLRHFMGLRCPDQIGPFFRIKVLEGGANSLAGCIYTGRDGMTAVLRQHVQDTGRREAISFSRNYKAAGFEEIQLSGAASTGISFRTRSWTPTSLCETLWHFAGKDSDFTLWLSYTLPTQQDEVGPAVTAFTQVLAQQN